MPTAAYAEFGCNRDAPVKSGHGVGTNVARLSLLLFLIPVLGRALAVALFGESVGPFEVTGVIATISALVVVASPAARQERPRT
jgi:hypothetical protein